jgi:hypothetical protein
MRPLDVASFRRCVSWTMRPFNDAFVTDLSRDWSHWTAYTWWIITKAGRRKLGFTPDAMGANRGIPSFADITGHTDYIKLVSPVLYSPTKPIKTLPQTQGVTKRCRLSWLTNSALVYEPNAGGWGRVCGISANEHSCAHGAQINFGNITPLFNLCSLLSSKRWMDVWDVHYLKKKHTGTVQTEGDSS